MSTSSSNYNSPGDESVGSSSNKIKLNFNHPCKELIWIVQPDGNVDYCSSLECGTNLFSAMGAQPFNYTDALDALPNGIMAFGGPQSVADRYNPQWGSHWSFIGPDGLFSQAGATDQFNPSSQKWNVQNARFDIERFNVPNQYLDGVSGQLLARGTGAYGSASGGGLTNLNNGRSHMGTAVTSRHGSDHTTGAGGGGGEFVNALGFDPTAPRWEPRPRRLRSRAATSRRLVVVAPSHRLHLVPAAPAHGPQKAAAASTTAVRPTTTRAPSTWTLMESRTSALLMCHSPPPPSPTPVFSSSTRHPS